MLLHLDFSSGVPIYQQIRNQIVLGIASGSLPPGTAAAHHSRAGGRGGY